MDTILTSFVLMHADYLSVNTNYYGTITDGMPGSFNSSQIHLCVDTVGVVGHRFIVFSKYLGCTLCCPRGDLNLWHARHVP